MISIVDMKALEDKSEELGVSKIQLMENAGKGIYEVIKEKYPDLKDKKILIVAYHGNNGGDGFVVARHLSGKAEVDVLFLGDEEKLKEEGKINFERIKNDVMIQLMEDYEQINFSEYDIIIDALLGTGFSGEIKEPIDSVIDMINSSEGYKIAVDVPSGMKVEADLVVTFHDIKEGMESLKDKTVIVDIGIKVE